MGFIKNLFGGDKDKRKEPPPRKGQGGARPPTARGGVAPAGASPTPAPEPPPPAAAGLEGMPSKQLQRLLGVGDAQTREMAAGILAQRAEVTSIRPLIAAYLNTGDRAILAAAATFGKGLTPPASHDLGDPGNVGDRRARLLDVLSMSGDPEAAIAVRPNVDSEEPIIHTRACMALARLGDMHGIDNLSHDLERNDLELRTLALDALRQLDIPEAHSAVTDHINRYLGNAGAVPEPIQISAPRLEDPDISLPSFIARHIAGAPHALTVVVGPGASQMAINKRDEILDVLKGFELHFTTTQHPPEEQIKILEEARDKAVANPEVRVVVFGTLPAPNDRPPLPHFLRKLGGPGYTAKIMIVDPHEVNQVVSWWRYVDETQRIPTDFEVVLPVSRPADSAISQEEFLLYQLTPENRRRDFLRAFVANL
jgi:hypothetical protein